MYIYVASVDDFSSFFQDANQSSFPIGFVIFLVAQFAVQFVYWHWIHERTRKNNNLVH